MANARRISRGAARQLTAAEQGCLSPPVGLAPPGTAMGRPRVGGVPPLPEGSVQGRAKPRGWWRPAAAQHLGPFARQSPALQQLLGPRLLGKRRPGGCAAWAASAA